MLLITGSFLHHIPFFLVFIPSLYTPFSLILESQFIEEEEWKNPIWELVRVWKGNHLFHINPVRIVTAKILCPSLFKKSFKNWPSLQNINGVFIMLHHIVHHRYIKEKRSVNYINHIVSIVDHQPSPTCPSSKCKLDFIWIFTQLIQNAFG